MESGDYPADSELAHRCLSGSKQAWSDFYSLYHQDIQAVVRRRSVSATREEREDFVQEVYASLVEALARYDGTSGSLRTFVGMVADRTCIDCWRGRSRKSRSGTNEPVEHHDRTNPGNVVVRSAVDPADQQLEQAEYVHLVRKALTLVSDTCRELLELRFFSELTYTAIAARLGRKENSVNQQILRCIGRLRAAFALLEDKEEGA